MLKLIEINTQTYTCIISGYQWKQGVVAILSSRFLIFTKRKRKIISFDVLVFSFRFAKIKWREREVVAQMDL